MKIIVSAAVSLDGYLDDLGPGRLILSSPEDWQAVYRLRATCDAILVGAETVRKDNPALVIRDEVLRAERVAAGRNPDIAKVTLTRTGDLDPGLRVFTEGAGEKIVFCGPEADPQRQAVLSQVATVVVLKSISAVTITAELARRGIGSLLVEGGSQVLGMFFAEDAVDEFRLAVAPFFVGQPGAPRLLPEGSYPFGKDRRMRLQKTEQLGDMAIMHYKLK